MAETSGFFNAEEQADGSYDREYFAQQFAYYFALFIGNGVFFPDAGKLQVVQNSAQNMSVDVSIGNAFLNGYWYDNSTPLTLTIENASPSLNRIDSIVLEWNITTRDIKAKVVKGSEAGDAQIPVLQRDDSVFQLRLAHIKVNQGITGITNAQIVDDRLDKSVCGVVTGVVDQVDTTTLYQQFVSWYEQFTKKAGTDLDQWTQQEQQDFEDWRTTNEGEFKQWFDDINAKLGTEPATNLQKQIDIMNGIINLTIPASGWQGASAPYSMTLPVPGIKTTDRVKMALDIPKSATAEQTKLLKKYANMLDYGEIISDGNIYLQCNVKKPEGDITVMMLGVSRG